nr:hypothetical protein [Tanacetum cinerariifolium]
MEQICDRRQTVHHNVYNPSSSIPQVEYAPLVNQQSDFSQPDFGLIVPVFQKGDDPIEAINHMMSFLTTVFTSRYPPTNNQLRNSSNPRQQATMNNGSHSTTDSGEIQFFGCWNIKNIHIKQMETIHGNRGLLSATTTKEKDTCKNNALNQKGKGMSHGSRIRCYWFKLKQTDKFYMRKS